MKPFKSFFVYLLLLVCIVFAGFYSLKTKALPSSSDMVLTGSTPGMSEMKSLLALPSETAIDFIRWHLVLSNSDRKTFILDIVYGEGQPNTSGFKGGGEKRRIKGEYFVTKGRGNADVYQLKSPGLPHGLSMIQLNENLFHFLTGDNRLMIGNGGWSYTLNRESPVENVQAGFTSLQVMDDLPADTARSIIYEGRTPCVDIAREYNLPVTSNCFKLKWKLTLHRDPQSLQPVTFSLSRTGRREKEIEGKWTIIKGMPSNPHAIIYRLDPEKPDEPLFLLSGDGNVLFFLRKDNRLFTGNRDFSFTLNRRVE